jgi:dTDP-4-amino-4,6-dideoxygalactose transaminase
MQDQSPQRVPFNELEIQWRMVADDVRRDMDVLFSKSAYSQGPFAEAFERQVAEWMGVRHAIGVNSGTSALHLAAIVAGLGPGDEVLVPTHTFIGTIWGLLYAGATPVLCDVDAATGNLDVADAARRVTPRTRAILPVHLYGQPADMGAVQALADKHGLVVIEDAAQAIGARWGGRMVGTLGAAGCVSFYPGKNLGAAGEAGLIVTDDDAWADRLRALRSHAQRERYVHDEIGFNYRLDGIQAIVLSHKLRLLDGWTDQRKALAARYAEGLSGLPLELPRVVNHDHVWHLYVVRTPVRDALRAHLQARNVETGLHYPVPLHRQPCLAGSPAAGQRFPEAERWAEEGLSLPLFVGMTAAQQDYAIAAIREFFARG